LDTPQDKTPTAIIVLGSPNEDDGKLYQIAKDRCSEAIKLYRSNSGFKFILTGCKVEHFNKAPESHAFYLKKHLIESGIPEVVILGLAESANTIEDASKSREIVVKYGIKKIIIVTTDFHVDRTRFIFSEIFRGLNVNIEYKGVETRQEDTKLDLDSLKAHEKWALERLKKGGIEGYYGSS
jgi:uncharacterized SAM-binding protein YcdF (DUF218 family)